MNKAILVMDMPESCSECIMERFTFDGECVFSTYDEDGNFILKCPLKELPNKKPLTEEDTLNTNWGEDPWFSEGWNECLKEILGDEYEID